MFYEITFKKFLQDCHYAIILFFDFCNICIVIDNVIVLFCVKFVTTCEFCRNKIYKFFNFIEF